MALDPRWKENQEVSRAASGSASQLVPALATIVKTGHWAEFVHPMHGLTRYATLAEYCREFLGLEPEAVFALLDRAHEKAAAAQVRMLLQKGLPVLAQHGGARERGGVPEQGDIITLPSGRGTKPDYLVRRLKRDEDKHPGLAAQVVAGEVTANAAAVTAGIRHPYLQVRGNDVNRAVARLVAHYGADAVRAALDLGSTP